MIYFIKSPNGPIKIGTTIRLSERLKQLATEYGPGLEVLAVVDGSFDIERELHGRFAHLRTVGEWFEPGDDLLGFIVSDGKAWDGSNEAAKTTSIKIEDDANELVRKAATFRGETVVCYASRILREQARKDLREGAEQFLREDEATKPARDGRKGAK